MQSLQPLKTGEAVCVKKKGEWRPTEVIEVADTPLSYAVKTSEGIVYRRNQEICIKMCRKISCTQPAHRHIETKKKVNQPTSGTRTFAHQQEASKHSLKKRRNCRQQMKTTNEVYDYNRTDFSAHTSHCLN